MPASYSFVSRWHLPVSSDRAWVELESRLRPGSRLDWWPALELLMAPRRLRPGERAVLAVRSPLGYRLRVRVELTEVVPGCTIAATAVGDLRGSGRVTIERAGDGASVIFVWEVATQRAWMNATAWLLRPVFAWAHETVMRRGERGMRAALSTRSEPRNAVNREDLAGGALPGD